MTAFEFRLGEADQKVYDRGDEWFLYDDDLLMDATPDELDQLEKAMGYRIIQLLTEIDEWGAQAIRAATWVGRRHAGIVEPWDKWQPKVMRISVRRPQQSGGDDAAPPDRSQPSLMDGGQETSPSGSDRASPAPTRDSARPTSGR
jgi:hypothetical protein